LSILMISLLDSIGVLRIWIVPILRKKGKNIMQKLHTFYIMHAKSRYQMRPPRR